MSVIRESACAKINLCLNIVGRRADGYHLLDTVMQSVSLCDGLTLEAVPSETGVRFICADEALCADPENTVYRAAELFFAAAGIRSGVRITLRKRIPMRAGLGGGSADAAAVLRGMNRLFGLPLNQTALAGIALSIGADVPFCLNGGTSRCGGIGERITRLPPLPDCAIVICKPSVGVDTAGAYRLADAAGLSDSGSCERMCKAIADGSLKAVGEAVSNDFLRAGVSPSSAGILEKMRAFSPCGAGLSGSGSAVFALFEREEDARKCERALAAPDVQTFLTHPVG